jgi:hypothetical protein
MAKFTEKTYVIVSFIEDYTDNMELDPEQQTEYRHAREELFDVIPEKCGNCTFARGRAGKLAMKVIDGEFTLEDAATQFENNLRNNC